VARGATYMFVQGFVSNLAGLVYFIILTRFLPREEMGVFAIFSFVLTLVQTFGTFALPYASTKYIAQYLAEGKPEKARGLVARVLQISVLTSIAIMVPLLIAAPWMSTFFFNTPEFALLFQVIAISSFFAILLSQTLSFLTGLQRIGAAAAVSFGYAILQYSVSIVFLFLGWRLLGVVSGLLLGLAVSSVCGLVLTARFLGVFGESHPVRPLINYSYPIYLSGVLGFFAGWVDQLFILPFMGSLYLGMYYVAVRASAVPGLISTAIVQVLFPSMSELYAQRGADSLKGAFSVSTRYAVLAGFPLIIGLATISYPVLAVFAGMDYASAWLPLTILCLASLPGAFGVALTPVMLTMERTKLLSILTVISILANSALSYITLALLNMGMAGAASARAITALVSLALSVYAVSLIVKIEFDLEALWKVSLASVTMAVAVAVSRSLEAVFPLAYLLPLYVLVGAGVYFLSLVALRAIKKRDVELIREYLPRGFKWVAAWLGRVAVAE